MLSELVLIYEGCNSVEYLKMFGGGMRQNPVALGIVGNIKWTRLFNGKERLCSGLQGIAHNCAI